MSPVIEAAGLGRSFDVRTKAGRFRRTKTTVDAVTDIDLVVQPGEIVGYIGPNGAGKSTTIKMLTGILHPTAGTLRVTGFDPTRQRVSLARTIGVVFGQRSQLWWDLPLRDSFSLLRHVFRVDGARHAKNLAWLSELLELGPLLDKPVRTLSLGQRMRGELAAALLHDPAIVFLDEPTIGLDVISKHAVRRGLRVLNEEKGTTVILTTHDLADVRELCQRLVIIDHGRKVIDGPLDGFLDRYGRERTLVLDLSRSVAPLELEGATCLRVEGPRQWLRFVRDETTAAQLLERASAVADVIDLAIEEPDIEDIVRRLYTEGVETAGQG